jgi:hypothetical protein
MNVGMRTGPCSFISGNKFSVPPLFFLLETLPFLENKRIKDTLIFVNVLPTFSTAGGIGLVQTHQQRGHHQEQDVGGRIHKLSCKKRSNSQTQLQKEAVFINSKLDTTVF